MARFSQLEFDETSPERQGPKEEPVRDAAYFYKEALRCWLAGDFELALRNYSRILTKNNTIFEAWLGQTLMLIELGEYNEAIVWTDKALELFPQQPELFAVKAVAFYRDSKMEKAVDSSDISVSKENTTSRVWLARAEVMFDRKGSIAESCLCKAVSMAGKEIGIIRLEAARLLRQKDNYTAAIEHLNEAIRIFPKSALAWYELGCCQTQLGLPHAKVTLEQSLKLRPNWSKAKTAISKCGRSGFFRKLFGR
jgi:tetratricopeptide (TPR) repeat protein